MRAWIQRLGLALLGCVLVVALAGCSQQGPAEGAMKDAGDKVQETAGQAADTMQDAADQAGEAVDQAGEQAADAMQQAGEAVDEATEKAKDAVDQNPPKSE